METVKHILHFNWILSVLLMATFYMSQAAFVENIYRKLQHGQNITGQIGAEHKWNITHRMFYSVSISMVRVRKLKQAQNTTGQLGTEHKGISHIEFSTL